MKIINSFLLALLLSTTSLFAQTDLKNGLVACYPFNANARDESGNANNGMVNGATLTTDRFGKVNNAYYFDGISNYIEISADKLQTETFSYSLWVKPSSIPSEGIAYFLFSVGSDNGDQAIGLNKGYTNGTDGFTGGGYLDIGENSFCQKGTSPNINQWYNVIFVREVDKYKVYLDGELICTTALVTKKPFYGNGTVKAIIGGRNNYGQFAHCSLDDIYIYNRAITAQEVSELYEVTKSPTAVDLKSGLVACYPFNANANDATGNGNNGTVNGATLTTDRFGKANSAYNFNGSSLISVNPAQFKNQSYTYATWVYLDNLPAVGDQYSFISVGGIGGDQVLSLTNSYQTLSANGFNCAAYNLGTPTVSSNWTGTQPNRGKWYHVAYTRDNTSIKLYVDGILIANNSPNITTNGTAPAYANPSYVTIGSRVGGDGYLQFLQGSLDDIYIYNRAITAQEVSALYEVTKSPTAVDLKTGLLACYPFNGNANDAFGNDNNGTVSGATLTNDRFGIPNSAYNFDGNSFIKLGNPNDFKNNTFTYAAWVKVPVAPEFNSLSAYSIVSIGSGQVLSLINRPAEGLFWGFTTYNDENISYDINPSSNLKTDINTWHHVVISRSPTQAKLYVDGTQIMTATTPVPTTATYTSSNPSVVYQATIGTRPDETNIQFFKGIIDDVHIYNRPLDTAEIRALYDGNTSSTITITSDKAAPCGGDNITFTANGASSTTQYRWKVDGVNVGTNSKFFVYNSSVKSTDYQVKVSVEVTGEECFPDGIATVENTVTIKNCNPCVDGVVACHPFTVVKTK